MSIAAISPVHAVVPRSAEQRAPAAVPELPRPLTPATAAVHLMQVPSSRVVETVASLQRAMGQQTPVLAPAAATAQRLAKAVAPAAPTAKLDLQA
jgi:hypothetical protein